jgi:8-hydroxy-5-deazaflavin:NADPH oxidoreductase
MKIAIIGAGNVGRALGRAWGSKKHTIAYGVRDVSSEKTRAAVAESGPEAHASSPARVVRGADVVVLAVPWSAAEIALGDAGDLEGKVLVDATNPLSVGATELVVGHTTSVGEQAARWAQGARVVKAFNTIGAPLMGDPEVGGEPASMLLCGDDPDAKRIVMGLAEELGFEPVDAGPLKRARLLEPLALLWTTLAHAEGLGTGIAFRLLRP